MQTYSPTYSKLLVLVNLAPESDLVLTRAKQLAEPAALHLLHVVEYVPVEPIGESVLPTMQIEKDLLERASHRLTDLATKHGLADAPRQAVLGSIKTETWRLARELQADLIVVGNHERHGLSALMNFTEDAVLHVAPCDVLAVHLPKVR